MSGDSYCAAGSLTDVDLPSSVGDESLHAHDSNESDVELPSGCGSHCDDDGIMVSGPGTPGGEPCYSDAVSLPSGGGDGLSLDGGASLPSPVDSPVENASDSDDSMCDLPDPVSDSESECLECEAGDDSDQLALRLRVPMPSPHLQNQAPHQPQLFAEFYSVPRVICALWDQTDLGGQHVVALDINTGWDFLQPDLCALSLQLLRVWSIMVLMLSPPCTAFSALQAMWNFPKLSPARVAQIWRLGMIFLGHAMDAARVQLDGGRFFAFEHPASATSWKQPCVQAVMARPGVVVVQFDQCMLGLTTKVNQVPTRKRTKIMTNMPELCRRLRPYRCDRSHVHCMIQGSEGGCKRSVWAQKYPPAMCKVIAESVCAQCLS